MSNQDSLVEKARACVHQARKQYIEGVGGGGDEGFGNWEQEGGTKNNDIIKNKANQLRAIISTLPDVVIPTDRTLMNSHRSYIAYVNGNLLKGPKNNRYFHGSPIAAARKVISIINKKDAKQSPIFSSVGIQNAVSIQLQEVTKGVRKSGKPKKPYVYDYFGWLEQLKDDKKFMRDDKEFKASFKSIAIPKRNAPDVLTAINLSKAAGKKRSNSLIKARENALKSRDMARNNKKTFMTVSALRQNPIVKDAIKRLRKPEPDIETEI